MRLDEEDDKIDATITGEGEKAHKPESAHGVLQRKWKEARSGAYGRECEFGEEIRKESREGSYNLDEKLDGVGECAEQQQVEEDVESAQRVRVEHHLGRRAPVLAHRSLLHVPYRRVRQQRTRYQEDAFTCNISP